MNSTESKEQIDVLKQELRSTARQILDETFENTQTNLLVAPGDAPLCVHAAAAGILHFSLNLIFNAWQLTGKIRVSSGHSPNRTASL